MSKTEEIEHKRESGRTHEHTHTHTLCNAYFTPVEQQHGLPIITSMNHGLPSGCQEDGGGGEDDGEQK